MIKLEQPAIGITLKQYRAELNVTVQALADKADVPPTLISGLQSGLRTIGENNARKIANALGLNPTQEKDFVFVALNSSAHRILEENRSYPAEILNLAAIGLKSAGITPDQIEWCKFSVKDSAAVYLIDGSKARIEVKVTRE